ncbi:serine/threonine-protein phosphatase 4 regulatory subunit 1-like isoform X2 [Accipiter gentilis]|uniref:serine/threonine-protein phosphatase 4 regulatory subunit 1-like isoform X2 n=1 Tax=Astur gentilis TaxID=8957 RepID=UPI00211023FD|nr:serine/threonine-protein phosphatase 4 regulatory subunit 1-like isoform X2 [Accipiter gentilis]
MADLSLLQEDLQEEIDGSQVEVLSAALRASSLDPQEETMASVRKGTESQTELTISDQQNFKPILGDIVPLIGDTVESNKQT